MIKVKLRIHNLWNSICTFAITSLWIAKYRWLYTSKDKWQPFRQSLSGWVTHEAGAEKKLASLARSCLLLVLAMFYYNIVMLPYVMCGHVVCGCVILSGHSRDHNGHNTEVLTIWSFAEKVLKDLKESLRNPFFPPIFLNRSWIGSAHKVFCSCFDGNN